MPTPGSRRSLLGHGGPWTQQRIDFNRLHGADSSSGTNPFTNPTNLNDGSDATHADRAADPHASAYPVQSTILNGAGPGPYTITLPSPVTAGNLLVMVAHRRATPGQFDPSATSPFQVVHAGAGRPFTDWSAVFQNSSLNFFGTILAYRIASGDEQTLTIQNTTSDCFAVLYEVANAGNPALFQVLSLADQAASTAKVLGIFSVPGVLEIMCLTYGQNTGGDRPLDQAAGTGWTLDYQDGLATGGGLYLAPYAVGHAFGRSDPNFTGGSTIWAGIAVGITTTATTTSICEADLGAAFRVNRMQLLEAADSNTAYPLTYWDGAAWQPIAAEFKQRGGGWQRYDFADLVAQKFRIADNHSPAIALPALSWYTWTIEGFPL